jgi:exopolysaccharide production protein ExoZ
LDRKFYSAEIDILRCLAAVSVALFHYTWMNGAQTDAFWSSFWSWGWVGVEIFFVISGMVIAASLEGTTPQRFVKARFLRLYPTAWICACISLVAIWSTGIAAYEALGIYVYLGLSAWTGSLVLIWSEWLASAYWTLPIEIAFYLLAVSGLVWGFARQVKTLAMILLAVSTPYYLALAYAAAAHWTTPLLEPRYGLENMALFRHGPYFALGIYLFWRTAGRPFSQGDRMLALYAFILSAIQIVDRSYHIAPQYARSTDPALLSGLTVAVFASAVALLARSSNRSFSGGLPRGLKLVRALGLATYPFYLLHEAVGGALLSGLGELGIGLAASVTVSVAVTGVVAYGVVRVERSLRQALQLSRQRE